MAFDAKHTIITNNQQPKQSQSPILSSELNLEELEFLLKVLGNADLKGNQVEMFYNMVIKLQNLYLQNSKK